MHDEADVLDSALNTSFDLVTLERGNSYFAQGRVSGLKRALEGFNLLRFGATVRGSGGKRYQCTAIIDRGHPERMRSLCSCPVEVSCKHTAAMLMQALHLNEQHSQIQNPTGSTDLQLQAWLGQLHQYQARSRASDPPDRLAYLLSAAPLGMGISVEVYKGSRRKNGTFGSNVQHNSTWAKTSLGEDRPRYIQPEDVDAIGWLRNLLDQSAYNLQPQGRTGYHFLQSALATQRLFWQHTGAPLGSGPALDGHIEWQHNDDATLCPQLTTEAGAVRFIPTEPALYLDETQGLIGLLEMPGDPTAARLLLDAPELTLEQMQQHLPDIEPLLSATQAPKPPAVTSLEVISESPQPVLTLAQIPPEQSASSQAIPLIRVSFRYGGFDIPWYQQQDPVHTENTDASPVVIHRQLKAEEAWMQPLSSSTPLEPYGPDGLFTLSRHRDWLDLLAWHVPRLERAGWKIIMDEDLDVPVVEPQQWYGQAQADTEAGWFNLELGIVHEDQTINLVPLLLQGLDHLRHEMDTTADGDLSLPSHLWLHDDQSLLRIPSERIKPLLQVTLELYRDRDAREGQLRLSRIEAARVMGESEAEWRSEHNLGNLARELADFEQLPTTQVPEGFHATLRDYQQQGLDWLQFLHRAGLGGILADDMGLGKTLQTLAHLHTLKQAGQLTAPALVICPTSVLPNWRHEAQRFTPALQVLIFHGPQRHNQLEMLPQADLVLSTYPLLTRDREHLTNTQWAAVVLDEAQKLKNPNAATTQVAMALPAQQTIALTGTPMENHLEELWSLFGLIAPGYMGDRTQFREHFRTPIEKHNDTERHQALQRRIRPFILRRTKEEVTPELPEKTEITRTITLSGAQRDLYETVRASMDQKVRQLMQEKGVGRSQIEILEALLKLRQACCHPALVKNSASKRVNSAKLDYLMEMLPALLEEGRRILIFSQFTSMLELIQAQLRSRDLDYALLTGNTRDRDTPINRFQNGDVPIFLISLRAGGVGLNLTAADCVIHYDPWWNPAVEDQATDRAWRIGQDKPVMVYRLVCEGTVEERMEAIKADKAALAESVYGQGGSFSSSLTAEDVQVLFQPIDA